MNPKLKRAAVGGGAALVLAAAAWLLLRSDEPAPPPPEPAAPPAAEAPPPQAPTAKRAPVAARDAGMAARVAEADDSEWLEGLRKHVASIMDKVQIAASLQRNAAKARERIELLCRENAALERHPPFHQRDLDAGAPRDAADFMAAKVDYEKNADGTSLAPPGSLHFSQDLIDRIHDYGPDWPTKMTPQDWAGLDFSWMQQLSSYDTWSMFGAGPLRDLPLMPVDSLPIPNFIILQQWAKMRLLKGAQDGDFATASAEVEHLADLIHSQGLLIDDMIGAYLLRIESRAAAATGQDASQTDAMDDDAMNLYRRVDFGAIGFFLPGVSADIAERASHCIPAGCSTIYEALAATTSLDAYTFGVFSNHRELLLHLADERHCEPALTQRMSSSPPEPRVAGWWPENLIDRLVPDGGV